MNRRTIKILVQVDAPVELEPTDVADIIDTLINAGLADAADTADLPEEDQIVDPSNALNLNIHSPIVDGDHNGKVTRPTRL